MTRTNDKYWAFTRDNIIEAALRKTGEYDSNESPTAGELTEAQFAMNAMIRNWTVVDGLGLWLRQSCILILNRGVQRYNLGVDGTAGTVDDFHWFVDTELVEGACEADELATNTNIEVTDTAWVDYAGLAVTKPQQNDFVGIRQDDLTIHWTTVASIASGSITLTTGLISAASIGAKIYSYTTRAPRPHGLVSITRETTSHNVATVTLIGRKDYDELSQKDSSGVMTQAHFSPTLHPTDVTKDYAQLMVWPPKNPASYDRINITAEFPPDEVSAASNNPSFPDEWAQALIWGLAADLGEEYQVSNQKMARIAGRAAFYYANLSVGADREAAPLSIGYSR